MKVTDVKIFKREDGEAFLGSASVVLDDDFVIYGIRVYDKGGKRYILFPSRKVKDKWVNICHPINKECRKKIEEAIFKAFDEE